MAMAMAMMMRIADGNGETREGAGVVVVVDGEEDGGAANVAPGLAIGWNLSHDPALKSRVPQSYQSHVPNYYSTLRYTSCQKPTNHWPTRSTVSV